MTEESEYKVRPVEEEPEAVEEKVDEKVTKEATPTETQAPKPSVKRSLQIPQIPTQKILKTMTNKEMMMQTIHDETMEPHVYLVILLFLVFILAIVITLIGI